MEPTNYAKVSLTREAVEILRQYSKRYNCTLSEVVSLLATKSWLKLRTSEGTSPDKCDTILPMMDVRGVKNIPDEDGCRISLDNNSSSILCYDSFDTILEQLGVRAGGVCD